MSENVFFNPGQAIASDFDFNKAYVAAQKAQKPVLVVQEKDGQPFVIFDEQAALDSEKEEAKRYSLVKRVTESD